MKTLRLAALAILSFPLFCLAQPDDLKNVQFREDFTEANLLMDEGLHNRALDMWLQLQNDDPTNSNLNYKIGYCYLKSINEKSKAQHYLETAENSRNGEYSSWNISDYDPFDPQERNCPKETKYYLGEAYLLNYELEKAEAAFQTSLEELGPKHHLRSKAQRGLEMTGNAKAQLANPRRDITISNMGATINNEFNDYSPVISVDENALFFTSRRLRIDSSNTALVDDKDGQFFEDIYVSYKNRNGDWQEPELLNINETSQHSATINVSIDGQELFIYKDSEGGGDIYQSALVGETWSDPESLGNDINSNYWETHGALSADGNTMYFVSDRPGGYGGRDIYRCVKLPTDEWSKPLILGPEINTKYDEDAPFIHPDGRTLYFASQGHSSMGGFDIFHSRVNNEGKWVEPSNVGYPINTVDDDVFYVTSADSRRAYFSSNRDGGYGRKDIYMVELPSPDDGSNLAVLKGFVLPAEGKEIPANTAIFVTDNETGETSSYRPRMRDGAFVAILEPCKEYEIDYQVNDKSIHTETLQVDCGTSYKEINREVTLDPINLNSSVVKIVTADGIVTQTTDGVTQTQTTMDNTVATVTSKEGGDAVISASPVGSAIFDKFFGYNEKDIGLDESRFQLFMNDMIDMINKNGYASIEVEGSASRVPTTTWVNNDKLANKRAQDAVNLVMNELDKRGIDRNKVKVTSVQGLIQGPKYKGDFEANRSVYEQFQYIRILAR